MIVIVCGKRKKYGIISDKQVMQRHTLVGRHHTSHAAGFAMIEHV
jgi:hypothetical protein